MPPDIDRADLLLREGENLDAVGHVMSALCAVPQIPEHVLGRSHQAGLRLGGGVQQGAVQGLALFLVEIVALVVDDEVEHEPLGQFRGFVDRESAVPHACADGLHGASLEGVLGRENVFPRSSRHAQRLRGKSGVA